MFHAGAQCSRCSSRWMWLCCCRRDTPVWQLMSELQHEDGDHLIAGKDTYDCFQVRQLSGRHLQRHSNLAKGYHSILFLGYYGAGLCPVRPLGATHANLLLQGTDLERDMRRLGVDTVIIAGTQS